MKAYYGLNKEGEELFYYPHNFILKKYRKDVAIDFNPSRLARLAFGFPELKIKNFFDKGEFSVIKIPNILSEEFRDLCYKSKTREAMLKILEIFSLAKDELKYLTYLNEVKNANKI